ncbi:MAG: hypothetical protein D6720_04760 [Gammaproteobacteria bacterium]|nr:MAG: hypothetical protein D6720_04760 [Gammaproteobacteria bacterium]
MDWTRILGLVAGIMMLVFLWPAYRHWSKNSPKAKKGDWASAIFALSAVMLLVLLLILSVR